MAVLQVLKGMIPGRQFPIRGAKAVLGRHPDCEIVVDVGAVSRQHAQVLVVGGEFYLEDLDSRNGTFVDEDGERSKAAARWTTTTASRSAMSVHVPFRRRTRSARQRSDIRRPAPRWRWSTMATGLGRLDRSCRRSASLERRRRPDNRS